MKESIQSIFNWNHISDELTEEQVEELKSYYHSYHKKCWAYKQAYKHYKMLKYIGNSISILTASSGIVSAFATGGISLIAISTIALLIKGYMEHQDLDLKIYLCQYAFQSYDHLLIQIKEVMRNGDFNTKSLVDTMTNIDNYVIDNSPIVDKYLSRYDEKFKH